MASRASGTALVDPVRVRFCATGCQLRGRERRTRTRHGDETRNPPERDPEGFRSRRWIARHSTLTKAPRRKPASRRMAAKTEWRA